MTFHFSRCLSRTRSSTASQLYAKSRTARKCLATDNRVLFVRASNENTLENRILQYFYRSLSVNRRRVTIAVRKNCKWQKNYYFYISVFECRQSALIAPGRREPVTDASAETRLNESLSMWSVGNEEIPRRMLTGAAGYIGIQTRTIFARVTRVMWYDCVRFVARPVGRLRL